MLELLTQSVAPRRSTARPPPIGIHCPCVKRGNGGLRSLRLQEYDFTVLHKAGKLHADADAISRLTSREGPEQPPEGEDDPDVLAAVDARGVGDSCDKLITSLWAIQGKGGRCVCSLCVAGNLWMGRAGETTPSHSLRKKQYCMPASSDRRRPVGSPLAHPLRLDGEDADRAPEATGEASADRWAWSLSSKYRSTQPSAQADAEIETITWATLAQEEPWTFPAQDERQRQAEQRRSPSMQQQQPPQQLFPSQQTVSAKYTSAIGTGLEAGNVGKAASFVVHGCDSTARPVIEIGLLASILDVAIHGPSTIKPRLESLANGTVRVWYTPEVSGKYSVALRLRGDPRRLEPLPGSPFTLLVEPAATGVHTPRAKPSTHLAAAAAEPLASPRRHTPPPQGYGRETAASASYRASAITSPQGTIRAADIRLRAPRGMLAHARAGEPARIELLAPRLGSGRQELPGRMKIVLHLQSPWMADGPAATAMGGDGGIDTDGSGAGAIIPSHASPGEGRHGAQPHRGRYFTGRVAFAPHHAQPGVHQAQPPPGFVPPRSAVPPCVFDEALLPGPTLPASPRKLGWGEEPPSLEGTLLYGTFKVPRAGNFLVHVTLDAAHVAGSPMMMRVAPAAACAAKCMVSGGGLGSVEAGRYQTVDVRLYDEHGNARRHSDEPVAGELTAALELLSTEAQDGMVSAADVSDGSGAVVHAGHMSASVSALADGTFAVGYTARQAGVWSLSIALDGAPVRGSPFPLAVTPAPLHPPSCEVFGQLHEAISGVAGGFEIRARDRFGNLLGQGGARLEVVLLHMDDEAAPTVEGAVTDHADGRYSVSYACAVTGRYALSVTTVNGEALQGSPFLMAVSPAPPSAARCLLVPPRVASADANDMSGIATVDLVAGCEAALGLRLADGHGNPTSFDARLLHVAIDETTQGAGGATSLAPASEFEVRALSEHQQRLSAAVAVGARRRSSDAAASTRVPLAGGGSGGGGGGAVSPRRAMVASPRGAPSPRIGGGGGGGGGFTSSSVASPSVTKGGAAVRAAASSRAVTALMSPRGARRRDSPGGSAGGGGADKADGADGADGGSGVLLVRIYRAGEHLVHVRLGAVELPGSPVRVRVSAAHVSAQASYVAHDALRAAAEEKARAFAIAAPAAPVSVQEALLTVLTADEYHNAIYVGGAAVGAKMSGPGACCTSVDDHRDGSYTVGWAAALSGTYRLSVLVNGAHIRGSPFGLHVDATQPGSPRMPPPTSPRGACTSSVGPPSHVVLGAGGSHGGAGSSAPSPMRMLLSPVAVSSRSGSSRPSPRANR